jgi:hypothetical protein
MPRVNRHPSILGQRRVSRRSRTAALPGPHGPSRRREVQVRNPEDSAVHECEVGEAGPGREPGRAQAAKTHRRGLKSKAYGRLTDKLLPAHCTHLQLHTPAHCTLHTAHYLHPTHTSTLHPPSPPTRHAPAWSSYSPRPLYCRNQLFMVCYRDDTYRAVVHCAMREHVQHESKGERARRPTPSDLPPPRSTARRP